MIWLIGSDVSGSPWYFNTQLIVRSKGDKLMEIPLHIFVLSSVFPLSVYSYFFTLLCFCTCMQKTSLKQL